MTAGEARLLRVLAAVASAVAAVIILLHLGTSEVADALASIAIGLALLAVSFV